MARMSIDDMVVRDPRITKLAGIVGWSRRETIGCLITDVWPICYDQREAVISSDLVDLAAGLSGFSDAMVRSELAVWVRGNRRIRIRGAQERIEYLDKKKRAGSVGGTKSAESRAKNSSITPDDAQALGNPSVPDPASASADPNPSPDPVASVVAPARKKREQAATQIPPDWQPSDRLGLTNEDRGQLERFRDHHRSKGNRFVDIEAAWRNWRRRAAEFKPARGDGNALATVLAIARGEP